MKQTQSIQFPLNDCLKLFFSMATKEPAAGRSYDANYCELLCKDLHSKQ